ncbi:TolC family protein [Marinoscillum furvescens]|uniref:Outer membrane protein n=1 Tax=Marinoscillum furvescens DSM 4134 TaxID=1122208 RepID=A0A3D9KZ70_MARFU|nr:TolC family protein [Marinoscillum furvescens]RED95580.1 outer membrane protein [Marinoscillum furvescens DSM 4134]
MKLTVLITCTLLGAFTSFGQSDSVRILDLQECITIAIDNNLSVKRSQLQQEGAAVDLRQARAGRLPNLNVGGGYGYNWGRSIDPTTNQFISQQINFTGLNGSSNVTLFNWFRITNSIKQSQLSYESAEYDVERAKNDISLNIIIFYLNVIFNRELLENAEYQLQSSQEQLDRTKKLVAGGALPRTSELELISQVATNEVNLVNAENNLNLALLSLKQAMLIPASQEVELVVPELELESGEELGISSDEVFEAALKAMPEIQSAQLQVQAAAMGVKVAEAGYAPSLSLNGSFSTNYSDAADRARPIFEGTVTTTTPIGYVQDAPSQTVVADIEQPNIVGEDPDFTMGEQFRENLSNQLSINLSVPIFNRLSASSNVQRAKISLQQAEIAVTEQKNILRQTIETAYNDAYAASKTYQASNRQVEALEETFRSVENQYNLGAANFTDYQVASNNLFQAKSDLVRAKFDFIFKKKILDFYQGKSLQF